MPLEKAQEKMEELREEVSRLLEDPFPGESPGKGGAQEKAPPSPTPGNEGFALPEFADEDVFQEFLASSRNALAEVESLALSLEDQPDKALPDLKRKIHTLKGEAGLLGLADLEQVCHTLEDFLETHEPGAKTVDLLLEVKDWIARALEAYGNRVLPPEGAGRILHLLEEVNGESGTVPSQEESGSSSPPGESDLETWDEDSLSLAEEFLEEGGEGITKVDETLLAAQEEALSPEDVDALFRVFHTIKGLAGFLELEDITRLAHNTEALLDQARKGVLTIEGPLLDLLFDSTETMRRLMESLKEAVARGKKPAKGSNLEEILTRLEEAAKGTSSKPQGVQENPPPTSPQSPSSSANEVQGDRGERKEPEKDLAKPDPPRKKPQAQTRPTKLREFVKVDLQRVDTLVALIGELVIAETMVVNAPELEKTSSPKLRKQMAQMSKITNDLQDIATRMRMVPVRDVFQKMARMVRDLSRKTGKVVRTVIEGASTEIDRGMVEQLGDPLVHIIRNAVDHGIETPEERERAGKPRAGTIYLRARHQGGNVVIEVADDGRGLDRAAILAKAKGKGLVKEEENLTDKEIYNLVFAPGFSTAKKLTEISGRGVGMDVVKRNIESIQGSASISSVPGKGSTIQLILPLTMAIIDGMLITCGNERYIIPTLSVVESIKPKENMVYTLAGKGEVLSVRGEIFPLYRLALLLGVPGAIQDPLEALVVIVECHGKKIGFLVDDVLTQQQVVIKGLGDGLLNTKYLSGAAILNDGRVGLILNMAEVATLGNTNRNRPEGR